MIFGMYSGAALSLAKSLIGSLTSSFWKAGLTSSVFRIGIGMSRILFLFE